MCCLVSWQGLCQSSGKEKQDSSLEQGGASLKVGTGRSAEADRFPEAAVTLMQSLLVTEGIFEEKRPGSPGTMMSLLPDGHSKPLFTAGLLMSPPFGSLLITPLSPSLGKPKNILVPTWGKGGSSHSSCFLCVLSPV